MAPSSTTNDEPRQQTHMCTLQEAQLYHFHKRISLPRKIPQQEVFYSKSYILALINELEKLHQPISLALIEELEPATQKKKMKPVKVKP